MTKTLKRCYKCGVRRELSGSYEYTDKKGIRHTYSYSTCNGCYPSHFEVELILDYLVNRDQL